MKNSLSFLVLLLMSTQALAASNGLPQPSAVRDLLNYGGGEGIRQAQLGTQVVDKKVQVMKALYDYTLDGGSNAADITLRDVDGKAAVIPAHAIIKQVQFDVLTAPTSGGSATLAFNIQAAGDIKAAAYIWNDSWTAGLHAGIPVGTNATMIKILAQSTMTLKVADTSYYGLSAGKINVFVEYYLSD